MPVDERKVKFMHGFDFSRHIKSEKSFRLETIEEFLARGGKITKCPPPYMCDEINVENMPTSRYVVIS